jgi:hypothetical protein
MTRLEQESVDCEALLAEHFLLRSALAREQAELQQAKFEEKAVIVARINAFLERIGYIERNCSEPLSSGTNRPPVAIVRIEQTQTLDAFPAATNPNRVQLVDGKATLLRVYVDVTGLPNISSLTGVLETRPKNGSGWGDIPLTPYNSLVPTRDADDMNGRSIIHILDFLMPAQRCRGEVDVRVSVYDAAHPGETGFTASEERLVLSFVKAPLPQS